MSTAQHQEDVIKQLLGILFPGAIEVRVKGGLLGVRWVVEVKSNEILKSEMHRVKDTVRCAFAGVRFSEIEVRLIPRYGGAAEVAVITQ